MIIDISLSNTFLYKCIFQENKLISKSRENFSHIKIIKQTNKIYVCKILLKLTNSRNIKQDYESSLRNRS